MLRPPVAVERSPLRTGRPAQEDRTLCAWHRDGQFLECNHTTPRSAVTRHNLYYRKYVVVGRLRGGVCGQDSKCASLTVTQGTEMALIEREDLVGSVALGEDDQRRVS